MMDDFRIRRWYVVENDLVGGVSIALEDKPMSENPSAVLADFVTKDVAAYMIQLHNQTLPKTPCDCSCHTCEDCEENHSIEKKKCRHGDPHCPDPDGDPCHYVTYELSTAMPCPITGIVGCEENHDS